MMFYLQCILIVVGFSVVYVFTFILNADESCEVDDSYQHELAQLDVRGEWGHTLWIPMGLSILFLIIYTPFFLDSCYKYIDIVDRTTSDALPIVALALGYVLALLIFILLSIVWTNLELKKLKKEERLVDIETKIAKLIAKKDEKK